MSGETSITIAGNLTADPELRFTQSGIPAANFTVASTPRTFDKQSGQWVDGDPLFLRCTVWRDYAEHVSESLSKGMRVIVQGNLRASQWTDKQGNNRTTYQIDVAEIGPSLRYATPGRPSSSRRRRHVDTAPDGLAAALHRPGTVLTITHSGAALHQGPPQLQGDTMKLDTDAAGVLR